MQSNQHSSRYDPNSSRGSIRRGSCIYNLYTIFDLDAGATVVCNQPSMAMDRSSSERRRPDRGETTTAEVFSARCSLIYTSRAYATMSVTVSLSVRLSVTEVHCGHGALLGPLVTSGHGKI